MKEEVSSSSALLGSLDASSSLDSYRERKSRDVERIPFSLQKRYDISDIVSD